MRKPDPSVLSRHAHAIFIVGVGCFVLSFLVPPGKAAFVPTLGVHARDYLKPFGGVVAFLETPQLVFFVPLWRGEPFDSGLSPHEIFNGIILMGAWLCNFTVFFRMSRWLSLIAIILPWAAYVCWFWMAVQFVPFYFWAVGLSAIHLSRISRFWPSQSRGLASSSHTSGAEHQPRHS